MARFFLALTLINLAMLVGTMGVGYAFRFLPELIGLHMLLGIAAALSSCLHQCVLFTYFLGTGRWVKEATLAHGLDLGYHRRSGNLKRVATFATLGSVAAVFAIAWLGGASASGAMQSTWLHGLAAWLGVALYIVLSGLEIRLVRGNREMLDRLVEAMNRAEAKRGGRAWPSVTSPRRGG